MILKQNPELICQPAGQELLIYHPGSYQAHCLEPESSRVFQACQEPRPLDQLADLCQLAPARLAEICQRLQELDLLQSAGDELERRTFLTQVGQAVVAAGIWSVSVPTAAAAASCGSATACGNTGSPLCSSCNPPGCTGTVVRRFTAFFNQGPDGTGGNICAAGFGNGVMAACDGQAHSVQNNCNAAKTAMEGQASQGTYYCCGSVPATCATASQCANTNSFWLGSPCCLGGTCRNSGNCL